MIKTGADPQAWILMEEIKKRDGKRVSRGIGAAAAKISGKAGASPGKAARSGHCKTVQNMASRKSRQQQN